VSILSVLRHLRYQPWYAVAEFVDNSLQSYLEYRDELRRVEGADFKLKVAIELKAADGGRLVIRDNAAGIHEKDYARAFRPAEIPPNREGMAEFGMGMKSAACWFANRWTVRTSALGEPVARAVSFDIEKIVHDRLEELTVRPDGASATDHFTEITLEGLHRIPQARTLSKIKQHLCSIYRVFLRRGLLELTFDGDPLTYKEVRILRAAHCKTPGGEPLEWRKEVNFDFGGSLRATGFAALRETASTSEAGFALFRRDRLIVGSADEGYRPEAIFGRSNSYRYQRLFGELHLEGFEVTHTKDGFNWDETEDVFLELLREELDKAPLPLLQQAEEYRVRLKPIDLKPAAELATQRTAEVIEREVPPVLGDQMAAAPDDQAPPPQLPAAAPAAARREIAVEVRGERWLITIELTAEAGVGEWLELGDDQRGADGVRRLGLRLALAHPFMERFGGTDPDRIEPLLRVAAGLALAETSARASGVRLAGTIRRNLNEFLRDALSKP
jgi:hypothetical protein